jgi:hypothetical protein
MPSAAPRISRKLEQAIERLARQPLPYAEINRRVGAAAETLGCPRPSYQQVRVLARAMRLEAREPTLGGVALDVAFRARPVRDLVDLAAGYDIPRRRS